MFVFVQSLSSPLSSPLIAIVVVAVVVNTVIVSVFFVLAQTFFVVGTATVAVERC